MSFNNYSNVSANQGAGSFVRSRFPWIQNVDEAFQSALSAAEEHILRPLEHVLGETQAQQENNNNNSRSQSRGRQDQQPQAARQENSNGIFGGFQNPFQNHPFRPSSTTAPPPNNAGRSYAQTDTQGYPYAQQPRQAAAPPPQQRQPQQQQRQPQQQQQQRQAQQQQQQHPTVTPPASTRALRQLPTVRVAPEDLVEETNRECCICLEANNLNDMVTRLPCAHIFHSECIHDWLANQHCTCPVCRYELPTNDPFYEAGRLERMKHRKPRYALYELQRMSIGQLKGMFTLNSSSTNIDPTANIVEKSELIQLLIDMERVHLIPSPKPVQYQLSVLQAMGVGQLKRTMEEAGVFFERCNVVEKADMVTIFQNSRRLELLPEDEVPAPAEELPAKEIGGIVDDRTWSSKTWMPTPWSAAEPEREQQWPATMSSSPAFRIETVESEDEGEGNSHGGVGNEAKLKRVRLEGEGDTPTFTPVEMFGLPDEDEFVPPRLTRTPPTSGPPSVSTSSTATGEAVDSSSSSVAIDDYVCNEPASSSRRNPHASSNNNTARPSPRASSSEQPLQSMPDGEGERSFDGQDHDDEQLDAEPGIETHESTPGAATNSATAAAASLEFQDCSISELQSIARRCNVELSQCVERREMVQLLSAAHASVLGQQRPLSSGTLSTWSVSQIRAVAAELQVDLCQCSNKEEMVQQLVHVANEDRPHLRDYLRALSPLATSSLSDLRAMAREWNVSIGDCLEKDEIIQRLVTRGQSFGIC